MYTQLQDALTTQVANALLAAAPDLDPLREKVERRFNCSPGEARGAIFEAVALVNDGLFPPLTQIELVLTEGCNLGCAYCFEKDMLGYRRMPLEVAQRGIDLLFRYSRDEAELHVAHFGGEPTLNFKAVKAVTEYAESRASEAGKRVHFNMTSNGVLIDEEIAEYCGGHNIRVLLSIDGLKATHDRYRTDKRGRGSFDRAVAGMKLLKKFQPWLGVKMTVMPENAHGLFRDVSGLYEMGVNQFTIGYATGIEWPADAMQIYVEQMGALYRWYTGTRRDDLLIDELEEFDPEANYFGCQAGRSSVSISVGGEVSPCSKILALNNRQLLSKLGDVWYGLTHVRNRAELVSCSQLRSACRAKGIEQEFQGGCFAANYDENGDLFSPNMQDHKFSVLQRGVCSGCNSQK